MSLAKLLHVLKVGNATSASEREMNGGRGERRIGGGWGWLVVELVG